MSEIEQQVEALKRRVSEAQRAQASAQQERALAEAQYSQAMETLKRDFSVQTVEEAKALLVSMDEKVKAAVIELEGKLTEAGV